MIEIYQYLTIFIKLVSINHEKGPKNWKIDEILLFE